jgi:hypothetical protein
VDSEDLDGHTIVDSHRSHRAQTVQYCFVRHPRIRVHFTLTSASYLNHVERGFLRDPETDSLWHAPLNPTPRSGDSRLSNPPYHADPKPVIWGEDW